MVAGIWAQVSGKAECDLDRKAIFSALNLDLYTRNFAYDYIYGVQPLFLFKDQQWAV